MEHDRGMLKTVVRAYDFCERWGNNVDDRTNAPDPFKRVVVVISDVVPNTFSATTLILSNCVDNLILEATPPRVSRGPARTNI
jgi:hypothetical protein